MRAREKRLTLILSELVLLVVGVYVSIFEFHLRLRGLWGLDVIVGALAVVLMIYDRFRLLPQIYEEREWMRDAATREESTAAGMLRKMILITSAVLVIGVVVFVYVWANTFE